MNKIAVRDATAADAPGMARVHVESWQETWVADPNPRAQAFYRKTGFRADGNRSDDGIPEIRMVRRVSPDYSSSGIG